MAKQTATEKCAAIIAIIEKSAASDAEIARAREALAMTIDPVGYWKKAFTVLYNDVAACEAPEGTQVDDVLQNHQTRYENATYKEK